MSDARPMRAGWDDSWGDGSRRDVGLFSLWAWTMDADDGPHFWGWDIDCETDPVREASILAIGKRLRTEAAAQLAAEQALWDILETARAALGGKRPD